MKRFATALLLLMVCASAWAVQIETGTAGQKVSTGNPLAVQIIGGAAATGTTSVIPAIWTTYTCSAVTVTNVSQNVASMAGRLFCLVQNLATSTSVWINPGAVSAASGSGNLEILPGQYWMDYVGPGINVPIIADTSTPVTVTQGK